MILHFRSNRRWNAWIIDVFSLNRVSKGFNAWAEENPKNAQNLAKTRRLLTGKAAPSESLELDNLGNRISPFDADQSTIQATVEVA